MRSSKTTSGAALVTVAALALFGTACGSSAKTSSPSTPSSPSTATTTTGPKPAPAITVTAGDYAYTGIPATIDAGIVKVTFVNKGSVSHELAFLKVSDNTHTTPVFRSLSTVFQGGAHPASFLGVNGVHDTAAGKTTVAQFNLTPGQYIALCGDTGVAGSTNDGQPHFMRGMFKQVTVTGTGGTTAPAVGSTLTAHDYGFDVSGLKAGTQTVSFHNTGPTQWHFADISVFPKGTTRQQAQVAVPKLLANPNGPPPAGVPQPADIASSQAASPGSGNTFTVTLEKGRTYIVACFLSDVKGGPPHAIGHHMYKVFTVS